MNTLQHSTEGRADIFRVPPNYRQHDYMQMRMHIRGQSIEKGRAYVILDCSDLDDPPSIAFGVFCGIARDANRAGGGCILAHVSTKMMAVLERTHIIEQVLVAATVDAAIKQFTSAGGEDT